MATLKALLKDMECVVGVLLLGVLSLLTVLSLFVSLSALVTWVAIGVAVLVTVVNNAGAILQAAVRGVIRVLGPGKAAALLGCLFAAVAWQVGDRCSACPAAAASRPSLTGP